jgi:uncharacterized membrane protein
MVNYGMSNSQQFVSQHFLSIVVILQVAMYVFLFLNFQFAREVIGVFYLTFIPGLIFIRLLKIELNTTEVILYGAGFSVAFLMIAGLAINEVGSIVGFNFPLATLPLSLFINTLIIIGAAAAHLRQSKTQPNQIPQKSSFSPSHLILTLIPIISIIGAYTVNATGNNFFLLVMILAIALVFTFAAFYAKSTNIYPFAIFMIALALLFQVSLSSTYLLSYGGDSPAEFLVFRTTQLAAHWNPTFMVATDQVFGRYNAMLSITILPTVYSNMLGMDPANVYKIIYPLIFALVPVALYALWQPYIGKKFAFFAAFLFIAESTFYTGLTALNRQMIGELFFVLLLLVILNKKLKSEIKFATFAVLSIGLIFSHYALAEIFLFLIFIAWAVTVFYFKRPTLNLQLNMILFFSVAMFAWYIYTSGAIVFDSFHSFATSVLGQLGGFFDPASRGTQVLTGLGLTQSPSFLNTISRGFAYLTELFIVLGIVALLAKKTHFRFDKDYIVFGLVAFAFLVALVAVPGLADALNMTRFYHILLMILAPFCIIGMWSAVKLIWRHEKKIVVCLLIVAVLVPYFLFQTNFVYEVAGSQSWSIPLSGYRMDPVQLYGNYGYIDGYSVHGALWVSANVPYKNNLVADNDIYSALTAYGLIYRGYVIGLTPTTIMHSGEYAYLSYLSVNYQQLSYNYTLEPIFNQTDLIYSNGGSNIYFAP